MKKMTMTMRMTKLFTLAALALMGVTMSSCGDDDENVKVEPAIDRMELLTNNASKEWLFYTQVDPDGTEHLQECRMDDVWTFTSNGSLAIEIGEKCYEEQEGATSEWTFNEDETFLLEDEEEAFRIVELTKDKLVLGFPRFDDEKEEVSLGEVKLILNAK